MHSRRNPRATIVISLHINVHSEASLPLDCALRTDATAASRSVLATGLAKGQTPQLNLSNSQQQQPAISFAGPIAQQRAAQLSPFQEALHKYFHGALGAECGSDELAQAAATLSPLEQNRLQNRVAIFSRQVRRCFQIPRSEKKIARISRCSKLRSCLCTSS